jgi:hypothetical protein
MRNVISLLIVVCFVGCQPVLHKKVLLVSNAGTQVDLATGVVNMTQTTAFQQQELHIMKEGPYELAVNTPSGSYKLNLTEDGSYVVNIKTNDTIVGSFQDYNAPKNDITRLTQVQVRSMIDSLSAVTKGTNITSTNRNFMILPASAVKISENADAILVAPYHSMKTIEVKAGTDPEVYRFYTNSDVRSTIDKMVQLSEPVKNK